MDLGRPGREGSLPGVALPGQPESKIAAGGTAWAGPSSFGLAPLAVGPRLPWVWLSWASPTTAGALEVPSRPGSFPENSPTTWLWVGSAGLVGEPPPKAALFIGWDSREEATAGPLPPSREGPCPSSWASLSQRALGARVGWGAGSGPCWGATRGGEVLFRVPLRVPLSTQPSA